jgi:hypothetical protein
MLLEDSNLVEGIRATPPGSSQAGGLDTAVGFQPGGEDHQQDRQVLASQWVSILLEDFGLVESIISNTTR